MATMIGSRRNKPRRMTAEMNVVPYIDVMLVLLVIFMVSAPMMNTSTVDLPTVGQGSPTHRTPIEVTIETPEQISVKATIGDHAQTRTATTATVAQVVHLLSSMMVEAETSSSTTSTAVSSESPPVVIVANRQIQYDAVMQVMDQLQQARIPRVGLLVKSVGGEGVNRDSVNGTHAIRQGRDHVVQP